MQHIAKTLLGLVGVSNLIAASTAGPEGMWLKILLAVVGFMATVTCLFYGQVLAHFNNHHKEKEAIIQILTEYIEKEIEKQKEICALTYRKHIDENSDDS